MCDKMCSRMFGLKRTMWYLASLSTLVTHYCSCWKAITNIGRSTSRQLGHLPDLRSTTGSIALLDVY